MRSAIGIVRVSRRSGREGASFISPDDQRRRIEEACKRDGLRLKSTAEEIDVSGGTPLDKRAGLREAIEAVEAGKVSVVVVGYFDRLFRSLAVQAEVVSRVEAVGGEVLALDFGRISEETAAKWLAGSIMGAFAEYYRRSAAERSRAAQEAAIARGVPPFPTIPAGLVRGKDGRLSPSPDAGTVVRAFELRSEGEPIEGVRRFLARRGVELTYRQVQGMLGNRLLIGEIHFGDLVNLEAHEPVVPRDLFFRVQRVKVPRGPRPASERLLARLGVLRCGICDSRMVVGTVRKGQYPFYRCASHACERRVTISAEILEKVVVDAVKAETADVEGRASVAGNARRAEAAAEEAQRRLDGAIRALADLTEEPAAQETLTRLRADRDEALEVADRLRGNAASRSLTGLDWERLNLAERRDLILGIVERISVGPGRGPSRIAIQFFV